MTDIKDHDFSDMSSEGSNPSMKREDGLNRAQADVLLVFANSREKELIPAMKLQMSPQGEIDIGQLVQHIKKIGFNVNKNMVSFFEPSQNLYIHAGVEPEYRKQFMPLRSQDENGRYIVKFRLPSNSDYTSTAPRVTASPGVVTSTSDPAPAGPRGNAPVTKMSNRRTKERKIGYIIEKVAQWRKLYNGFTNKNGEFVRLSLEEAAQKVNISKKSLDDYLLQLRFGRKFGFNFNQHKDDKVGTLRAFVKKNKAAQNQGQSSQQMVPVKEENAGWIGGEIDNPGEDNEVYQGDGFQAACGIAL